MGSFDGLGGCSQLEITTERGERAYSAKEETSSGTGKASCKLCTNIHLREDIAKAIAYVFKDVGWPLLEKSCWVQDGKISDQDNRKHPSAHACPLGPASPCRNNTDTFLYGIHVV
jgi:hypothetical protein